MHEVRASRLARDDALLDELIVANARSAGTELLMVGAQWLFERVAWEAAVAVADALVATATATATADEGELIAAARRELINELAPLVDALVARRLRPRRALWRSAGDRVAQAFLWTREDRERPQRAARMARALLEAEPSLLAVPVRTGRDEAGEPLHLRSGCCLSHRTPAREVCPGCPLSRAGCRPAGAT